MSQALLTKEKLYFSLLPASQMNLMKRNYSNTMAPVTHMHGTSSTGRVGAIRLCMRMLRRRISRDGIPHTHYQACICVMIL
jgi:hypothetical protein